MKSTLVLIVTKQGALQNGLLALLTTIPQISTVLIAEDAGSGVRMLQAHHPGLLLLDMDLHEDDALTIIKQLKTQSTPIQFVALVDSVQQGQKVESLGADGVLLKGFSATSLMSTIEEVCEQQREKEIDS